MYQATRFEIGEALVGKFIKIDPERCYGFVKADRGGRDLFVHCSDLLSPVEWNEALEGARCTFNYSEGPKGGRAAGVRIS